MRQMNFFPKWKKKAEGVAAGTKKKKKKSEIGKKLDEKKCISFFVFKHFCTGESYLRTGL